MARDLPCPVDDARFATEPRRVKLRESEMHWTWYFFVLAALAGCDSSSTAEAAEAAPDSSRAGAATGNSAPTAAAAPTPELHVLPPDAQAAWDTAIRARCREYGERFVSRPVRRIGGLDVESPIVDGFIPADFNGDGRSDFLVFIPGGCAGDVDQNESYGSRGGPPIDFVISFPSGYRVMDGPGMFVVADEIRRQGGRDVIVLDRGRFGSCGEISRITWGWTGSEMEVIERRNERGQLVDEEGCAARPQPAAAPPARSGDLRVPSAAMPLPIGYYVQGSASCEQLSASNPAMIGYLGRDRFVQVTSGRFVSFRRAGPDRYVQTETFPSEEGGPGDTQSSEFTVNSESSFRLFGREDWTYCPLDRVPRAARFIDSPQYRNDPRIRAVRGR